jgi:predicted nucleotidyltransferase
MGLLVSHCRPGELHRHKGILNRSSDDRRDLDLDTVIPDLLRGHPAIRDVRLAGSRATGETTPLSDWDFNIETDDFPTLAPDLPEMTAALAPLAGFWDPFSDRQNYILLLRGPVKVDLIFPEHHRQIETAWEVDRESVARIDVHFWDWTLWLGSKVLRGEHRLVTEELAKMRRYLLGPLGLEQVPESVEQAVRWYLGRREQLESEMRLRLPRELGLQVCRALKENGFRLDDS